MLSVGGTNYRPPLERSKSAPKLTAIEEAIGEEDGEEVHTVETERNNKQEPKTVQHGQYQTLTFGRRGVKSIRRKRRVELSLSHDGITSSVPVTSEVSKQQEITISDEEFEKFLQKQDASDEFSGELLSYLQTRFDDNNQEEIGSPDASLVHFESPTESNFSQDEVINFLTSCTQQQECLSLNPTPEHPDDEQHKELKRNNFDSDMEDLSAPPSMICVPNKATKTGSEGEGDAGSISSGCETSSTITNLADDGQQKSCSVLERIQSFEKLTKQRKPINIRRRHDSTCLERKDATENFQRSITVPAPGSRNRRNYPTIHQTVPSEVSDTKMPRHLLENNNLESIDSDSDESGYVEYQETTLKK